MSKKKINDAELKKLADRYGKVKTVKNPDLKRAVEIQAGELYEGVTDDAEVSDEADYRMITKSDDTASSQNS